MTALLTSIDNLYTTFKQYTSEGISYCDCGCIDIEDVEKLNSKPLRELEFDDLIAYHGSALFTWGEVVHYKHYLPRICELISTKRDSAFVSLDELYVKLEAANWKEWPLNEQQTILQYVIVDWIECVNSRKSAIRDAELAMYCNFFELKDILSHWNIVTSEIALRNFVFFFYFHGSQILNGGLRILDKKYSEEFQNWIYVEDLMSKLEASFFMFEQTDSEYAEKISIVLQMLEQQRSLLGR